MKTKVEISNANEGLEAKPGSLWTDPKTGIVYLLYSNGLGSMAISVRGDSRWADAKKKPERAVDGLIPFYGEVSITQER